MHTQLVATCRTVLQLAALRCNLQRCNLLHCVASCNARAAQVAACCTAVGRTCSADTGDASTSRVPLSAPPATPVPPPALSGKRSRASGCTHARTHAHSMADGDTRPSRCDLHAGAGPVPPGQAALVCLLLLSRSTKAPLVAELHGNGGRALEGVCVRARVCACVRVCVCLRWGGCVRAGAQTRARGSADACGGWTAPRPSRAAMRLRKRAHAATCCSMYERGI